MGEATNRRINVFIKCLIQIVTIHVRGSIEKLMVTNIVWIKC